MTKVIKDSFELRGSVHHFMSNCGTNKIIIGIVLGCWGELSTRGKTTYDLRGLKGGTPFILPPFIESQKSIVSKLSSRRENRN